MTCSTDPRCNRRLAVLALTSAMAGLSLMSASPAEAVTTCVRMPCAGSGGAATSSPASTDSFPSAAPDFSGDFRMSYSPVMCVKAPCPPGHYFIRTLAPDRARFTAQVRRILLRAADGGEPETFEGRYIGGRGLSVEGDVWIEGRVAYVLVRRTIDD